MSIGDKVRYLNVGSIPTLNPIDFQLLIAGDYYAQ